MKRRSAESGLNREPDQAASLQSFFLMKRNIQLPHHPCGV
jgi:hypothetical protein